MIIEIICSLTLHDVRIQLTRFDVQSLSLLYPTAWTRRSISDGMLIVKELLCVLVGAWHCQSPDHLATYIDSMPAWLEAKAKGGSAEACSGNLRRISGHGRDKKLRSYLMYQLLGVLFVFIELWLWQVSLLEVGHKYEWNRGYFFQIPKGQVVTGDIAQVCLVCRM